MIEQKTLYILCCEICNQRIGAYQEKKEDISEYIDHERCIRCGRVICWDHRIAIIPKRENSTCSHGTVFLCDECLERILGLKCMGDKTTGYYSFVHIGKKDDIR